MLRLAAVRHRPHNASAFSAVDVLIDRDDPFARETMQELRRRAHAKFSLGVLRRTGSNDG